jgi:[NiFe] hydrogenase diaphorase moiety large subunit
VVNNVETFACAAKIAERGGAWFAALGTPQSAGSKLLSVSGDCERPGIYEYPFGVTVRQVLDRLRRQDAQAVQVSGPSGTCISFREFDRRIAFEDLRHGRRLHGLRASATCSRWRATSRTSSPTRAAASARRAASAPRCCATHGQARRRQGLAYDMNEMKNIMHSCSGASHCGLGHTACQPGGETLRSSVPPTSGG